MGILDGIVSWLAEQVMNILDMISTSVLGALGCNMETFIRYFPAAETMYHIFVALAIGLILLNMVWQLFKNFGLAMGTDAEDPVKLIIRSMFFIILAYYADDILNIVRFADNHGKDGKLPVPVNMVLDEFPNIGAIPDFKKKISTTRSRAINISVIFQNLAQLQNRHPDGAWQEILGNCDTQLFLGCTDDVTAKLVADRTGEVTVAVASKTKNLNTWRVSDYTPE